MAYADFVSYVRKKEEDEEKKRREEAANLLNRNSGSQDSGYQKFVQYVEEKERREDPILAKREQEEYSSWISNLQNFRNNFADEWDSSQSIWKNPSSMEEQRNKIQAEMGPLSVLNSYYSYQLEKNKDAYSSVFGQKETEDLLDAMNRNKEYFKNVDSAVRDREKMFSRFDSQEEYNEALDAQKDYERLSVMDIDAAKKRLEELEKQLESAAPSVSASGVIDSYTLRNRTKDSMEEEARNLRKDILNAEEIQSIKAYDEYRNDPEFEKYAQMGAEIENPSFEDAENYWQIGPWKINPPNIGNIVTYSRDNADQLKTGRAFQEDNQGDYRYSFLSEDEVEMYNYLLTKQGEEAANEYLNLLNKNLDSRAAQDIGYNFRNIDNGTIKLLAAAKAAANSGVLRGIGINDTLSQQVADQIYNELHNPESQLFGRSIGQMGFEALSSAAQMSPSMLVSALTSGAGAPAALSTAAGLVSFGAPIQAKTYQDMLRQGYTEEEAARYGALSAISETSLQYILGGISALGGKVSGNLGRKALQSIDNAWLRIVADLGIKMGSEGTEEYLQEILDPVFRNLVLGEDNEIKLFTEDAAYSFLLGSLTAGLMEGGHVTMSDLNLTNVGEAVVDLGRSDDLIYRALQMDTNTESYKLASKMQSGETVGNRKAIGELFATYAQEGGDVSFFTNNAPTHTVNEKAPTAEEASTSETAGQQEITPEITPQNPSAWQNTFTENVPEEIASANIQKIEEVSSTLGKAGSSALKSFYDGTISPDVYYGGFTALYEAGISGRDISRVENERTTQLNRAQKEAAYLAGQSDAEYSLRMEKQNSEKAVFKKAGFVKNEYSANIDRKTIRLYDSMAKSLGVQIQIAAPTGKNGANGWYQNGTIYIAADAENSGFVVAKHEITHRLQELSPAAYRKYRDYAVNAMSEQSDLSVSLVEQYKSRYAESGVRLNTEQAMDEIAADFTEAIVTDPKRFEGLVRQNRSVAEKVLDSIRNFISKIKSAFHRSEDRNNAARETFGVDLNTLEEAERLWSKALEEGSRQAAEKNREKSILSEAKNGILKSGKLSLKRGEKYGRETDESGIRKNGLSVQGVSGEKTDKRGGRGTAQTHKEIYSSSDDADGRLSNLNKDYTFGEKPKAGWAVGGIVEPKQGSLAQRNQQIAALYGVPSFVVRENVYNKNYSPDTPAFTYGGQIYLRETLPEDHEAIIVFHELVHAMEQNRFRPYLDFLEDTLGRINMSNPFTMEILSEIDSHYEMDAIESDPSDKSDQSQKKSIQNLYDDFNAILYGIYKKGEKKYINYIRDTVDDFDRYMEELSRILLRFQEERTGTAKKFSLKDGEYNDEERKETRGDFLGRCHQEGLEIIDGGRFVCGYRRLDRESAGENARQVLEEITNLGIDADIIDGGQVLRNAGGVTAPRQVLQATTVARKRVLINRNTDLPHRNIAGHEAFHFWKNGTGRETYIEIVRDNLNFSSKAFLKYQSSISQALFGQETDFSNTEQTGLFTEELFAYISGDIHEGTNDDALRPMFRDFDTVRAAWERLVEENRANGIQSSIKRTEGSRWEKTEDSQGRERTSEQQESSRGNNRRSVKGNTILRENAALKEENSILRERVEYWKGQTRRTQRVTTDKKAVARAAKELIRTYNSNIPVEDISADLQSLYDYIASGYDGNDELTYSEARRRSDAIAQKLVESATILDDENYRQYRDLRDYFRTTKLSISDTDSHDISDYGSFRRRNFGRIHLSKGNTNIDQVFQEAAAIWPEFFDEQIYSTPSDQLLRIAEVLDGIYSVEERNPFGSYLPETIADASNEIMERFFDLPQTKKTFADRQASRIEETRVKGNRKVQQVREQMNTRLTELRKQSRERIKRAVQRERETRARQMERLKTKYAERDIAGRERRSARELRARIIRHTNDLSKKLLRPTDNQHVPETLRKAVSSMLESINLESLYTIDPATGKRTKNGNGDPVKRTEAFRELRQVYSNITKEGSDYTLVIDPDLMDNLLEIESMKNIPIDSMNTSQLQVIWKAIRGIEASITTANKMLGRSKFERISQVAEGILQDNKDIRPRKNWKGPAGKAGDLIHMDMLTPVSYFHRLGKTGDSLFRMLRDADDEITLHIDEARKAAGKIVGNDAEIIKWEEEKHSFTIEGETFTLTTAQIMTLYELMKRDQAREHLLKGGIRPDSTPSVAREKGRPEPVKLSWNGYKELTDALTEEQKKIADSLQRYMEKEAAEWGNEASMEVYGYRKFTESGYFPIKTDANQTIRDVANEAHAGTIAGRGFTKQTNPKATNALMVGSIFDVFSEHIQEMAIYSARLAPMENIKRIQNFTFRDENGNRIGTVKSVIERVFGKRGNHYLNTLLDQLNQGVRTDRTEIFSVDALIRNYKAASVALNLRVILQQPTSYMRTWLYLNPLRFWEPFDNKYGGYKMAKKYAPIAIWKDWGYFDINTGRKIKDVLFNTDSFLGKTRNVFMKPAAIADSLTWGRIWNAVAAKVNRENPGLRANNEEFYKKVAEKFNEIIDNTQVVDGILQRSQIMRSGSSLTKMATSFMSESTKIYNMFANALYDFRHARKEVRGKALKKVGRTAFSLVSSFAITAAVQSIVDAFRDDDKEEDYWYKFLVAYFGNSSNPLENLVEGNFYSNFNPLTYLPYGKDLLSILQGYDVNRMDMETVSKFVSALDIMQKAMIGEGKYTKEYAWINLASETARFLGVPVANLKRDIMAGINHVSIVRDNYLLQYKIEKFIYSPSQSSNRSRFVDILYNAMEKDRETYELIYADMKNSGMDMEKIDSALEKKMREAAGVTSARDLEKRYVSPEKEEEYNSYLSDLESSSLWGRVDDDVKASVKDTAYQIVVESDTGKKAEQKANAAGVDNGTYMLYRLALNVADSDNNGSYTQEEAEAAIRLLQGLSEEEKVGLWQSTNTRWDTEKNPFK